MIREEFESMIGTEIPQHLFDHINEDYMTTDEDKAAYVKRVFGGPCGSARVVLSRMIKHDCQENRRALRGNPSATPERLRSMDQAILFHYRWMVSGTNRR